MINPFFLPSVSLHDRAKLREEFDTPGVYFCMSGWDILYIGEGKSIYLRWNSRRYGDHHKLDELMHFEEVNKTEVRIHCWHRPMWRREHDEARMIRKYDPPMNERYESTVWWISFIDWCRDSMLWGIGIFLAYAAYMVWKACS